MKKVNTLNGLKTILCIGIVVMHVKANTNYEINNYIYNTIIPSFANFVFLFMMISSFGMCCGYYEKMKHGQITVNDFFKRRISKILPFFAIVILIDVAFEHSILAVLESTINLTLLFGLASNYEISVIGVGWFIGVIFLFYIFFPYFVFLLNNKKRAWVTLIISIILNFLCIGLLNIGKKNILFDLCYFVVGGIIYLYKDQLKEFLKNKKVIFTITMFLITVLCYIIPNWKYINTVKLLLLYSVWMIYVINFDGKMLNNKFTKFISEISMEIYLSHMIIFRVIEKLGLINLINIDIVDFCLTSSITLIGVIIFDLIVNRCLNIIGRLYFNRRMKVLHE